MSFYIILGVQRYTISFNVTMFLKKKINYFRFFMKNNKTCRLNSTYFFIR